jgi:deoxyribodipyrimidine photo-lyase
VSTALVWFRRDLRLADNPALHAAIESGARIIPVFIWSPDEDAPWAPGTASRWWLHHSLQRLDADLRDRGSRLIIRQGATEHILLELATATGAQSIFWNRL